MTKEKEKIKLSDAEKEPFSKKPTPKTEKVSDVRLEDVPEGFGFTVERPSEKPKGEKHGNDK